MFLLDKDYLFLKILLNQKVLNIRQIKCLVWDSYHAVYVYVRLGKLVKSGLVRSESFGTDNRKLFFLTQAGLNALRKAENDEGLRLPKINRNELNHDLLVNDVRVKLYEMGFPVWVSERDLLKNVIKQGVPDGAFEVPGKGRTAVEIELTQKKLSIYHDHFRKMFREDRFPLCIYLVRNQSLKNVIDREAKDFGGVYSGLLDEFLKKGYSMTLSRSNSVFEMEKLRKYAKPKE